MREEQQKAAAESLRKRLKAELRPDLSTDGLHQIQLTQRGAGDSAGQNEVLNENQSNDNIADQMPSLGIRRVSTKWDHYNPFHPLKSSGTKSSDETEATGHGRPRCSQDGNVEREEGGHADMQTFASVALASVPESRRYWRASISAPWQHSDLQPYPYQKLARILPFSMSANINVPGWDPSESSNSNTDSSIECFNMPVVIASVECELAHPRPSRSSETRLLKVLVKGKEEAQDDGSRRKSQISQGSASSFHTARQEDSG